VTLLAHDAGSSRRATPSLSYRAGPTTTRSASFRPRRISAYATTAFRDRSGSSRIPTRTCRRSWTSSARCAGCSGPMAPSGSTWVIAIAPIPPETRAPTTVARVSSARAEPNDRVGPASSRQSGASVASSGRTWLAFPGGWPSPFRPTVGIYAETLSGTRATRSPIRRSIDRPLATNTSSCSPRRAGTTTTRRRSRSPSRVAHTRAERGSTPRRSLQPRQTNPPPWVIGLGHDKTHPSRPRSLRWWTHVTAAPYGRFLHSGAATPTLRPCPRLWRSAASWREVAPMRASAAARQRGVSPNARC
jgi:hypothetical protein